MLGWVLGVAAAAGMTASAAGQFGAAGATGPQPYPPLKWVATEQLDHHVDAHDEAVDMEFWLEDGPTPQQWVYVTGWLTEVEDGEVVGTRIATFKYDATYPGPGAPPHAAVAYFPDPSDPTMPLSPGEEFKAVAMAVDGLNGDVYVAGYGPRGSSGSTSDANYVVIRYDKDLVPVWTNAARYYDGLLGADIPADVMLDGDDAKVVLVTGTSMGPADPPVNTQQDIVTVAWEAGGGIASDAWPDIGWGAGVRRYDYAEPEGDDVAVGLGYINVVIDADAVSFIEALVGGTSYEPGNERDYTVHLWGGSGGTLQWDISYDNGGDDVMTAIWPGTTVYVTGYSEDPMRGDYDFATVAYRWDVTGPSTVWPTELRKDFNGGDDVPLGFEVASVGPCGVFAVTLHIWVTGAAEAGSQVDAATVHYDWPVCISDPVEDWSDSWSLGHNFTWGRGLAVVGADGYVAGTLGMDGVSESLLALKYEPTFLPPPDPVYEEAWFRTHHGGGPLTGLPGRDHEGRRVIVRSVDPGGVGPSVFIAGVSTVSGEGRQFTTWRFRED